MIVWYIVFIAINITALPLNRIFLWNTGDWWKVMFGGNLVIAILLLIKLGMEVVAL
jgi:hypothetical protein